MRNLFGGVLAIAMSLPFAAQAFTVDVESAQRNVALEEFYYDQLYGDWELVDTWVSDAHSGTGYWEGNDRYQDQGTYTNGLIYNASNVDESGSYSEFDISYSLEVACQSLSYAFLCRDSMQASFSSTVNVRFDTRVTVQIDCVGEGGVSFQHAIGGVQYGCGDVFTLAAGAHQFSSEAVLFGIDQGLTEFGSAVTVSAVPAPAAAWLFGSALAGLVVARRRRAGV